MLELRHFQGWGGRSLVPKSGGHRSRPKPLPPSRSTNRPFPVRRLRSMPSRLASVMPAWPLRFPANALLWRGGSHPGRKVGPDRRGRERRPPIPDVTCPCRDGAPLCRPVQGVWERGAALCRRDRQELDYRVSFTSDDGAAGWAEQGAVRTLGAIMALRVPRLPRPQRPEPGR